MLQGAVDYLTSGATDLTRCHDTVDRLRLELDDPLPIEQVRAIIGEVAAQSQVAVSKVRGLRDGLTEAARELAEIRSQIQAARLEAMSDSLTGLANRVSFEEHLQAELKAADETLGPLSILLVDIDDFRGFNQSHGDLVGDHLLKLVARLITRNIKGRDRAARIGGDEFAIILSQTEACDAEVVAEQIRKVAAASEITNRARTLSYGHFALSVGVAGYRPGESPATLVQRADQALRRAKTTGRNRVCGESDQA